MTTAFSIVAALAALALVFAALSRLAEKRHPPAGRFVDCGGIRLHYVERGSPGAPAVVMMHGNGSMIQDLASSGLVDRLATRYRVISFDRPGYGHSTRPRTVLLTPERQADLFAAAFDRLGIRNPVVLGHSWGTLVALALAFRPDRPVRGLVLAAGYYFPTRRWDVWLLAGPALPVIGDIMCYTLSPILGWLLSPLAVRILFGPRPVPERFKAEFPISLALRPKQLRAAAEECALMIPAAARLQAHCPNLPCPIAVFGADHDAVVEPDQAPRLHGSAPRSVMHIVHDTGHMLHHAVPDELAAAVECMSPAGAPFASPDPLPHAAPEDAAAGSTR